MNEILQLDQGTRPVLAGHLNIEIDQAGVTGLGDVGIGRVTVRAPITVRPRRLSFDAVDVIGEALVTARQFFGDRAMATAEITFVPDPDYEICWEAF